MLHFFRYYKIFRNTFLNSICPFLYLAGCGSTSSENCTYFEVNGANSGACRAKICKCSSDICQVNIIFSSILYVNLNNCNIFDTQIRLDFTNFQISGPSTLTLSIGKIVGGQVGTTGKKVAQKTTCATDSFSVSNAPNVPVVCGTLTGDHGKLKVCLDLFLK